MCKDQERETIEREIATLDSSEKPVFLSNIEFSQNDGGNIGLRLAVGDCVLEDEKIMESLLRLKESGIDTITTIRWCEERLQRIPPELITAQWLVQAEGFALRPGSVNWRIKRFGDVVGASVLLLLTMPVIIIAAALVYVHDKGPVFYEQKRTGYCGKEIKIWKLRSMKVGAEDKGAQWATKDDPRITRVGKFIRKTRIDELPQLVSVIAGELSLIGPRPERGEIEIYLEEKIPHYRVRHWIRPGLSGWAQVCYPYGSSIEDSRQKLSYDLYYLRNSGLLLDILIAIKTIRLVLRKAGSEPNS